MSNYDGLFVELQEDWLYDLQPGLEILIFWRGKLWNDYVKAAFI
jgi:hypothetical protein